MVDQESEAVKWVVYKCFCSGGCSLLASDMPEGLGGLAP